MKKISFLFLLAVGMFAYSQEVVEVEQEAIVKEFSFPRNEVKLNLLSMIFYPALDLTYERLINEELGLGVSGAVMFDEQNNNNYGTNLQLVPYARWYFSGVRKTTKRPAAGFFIEGNVAFINFNKYKYETSASSRQGKYSKENMSTFGVGAAIGWKYVTPRNWIGEINLGIGRSFSDYFHDVYPRVGLSIGKRF